MKQSLRTYATLLPILSGIKSAFEATAYRVKYIRKGVRIFHDVELSKAVFEPFVQINHHAQIVNSSIGLRSSIGRYTKLRNVSMGRYCSVSFDSVLGAAAHPLKNPSTHMFWHLKQFGVVPNDAASDLESRVTIGNDVWIGCHVVIQSGVTIGDGAVIGAGAVVTKDVPPYAIVVGVPAKILRYRFSKDLIQGLEEIEWWNWEDRVLRNNISWFAEELTPKAIYEYEHNLAK